MGQVHTLSTYAPQSAAVNISGTYATRARANLMVCKSMMQKKEKDFYQKFFPDCKTGKNFTTRMNLLLTSITESDKNIIANFTSGRLINLLKTSYEKNFRNFNNGNIGAITFNLEGSEQAINDLQNAINAELAGLVGTGSGSVVVTGVSTIEGLKTQIQFGLNPAVLKTAVNAALGTRLNPNSSSLKHLQYVLAKTDERIADFGYSVNTFTYDGQMPFGAKKGITKTGNKKIGAQLEKMVRTDIENQLNLSAASPELNRAFNFLWSTQIAGKIINNINLSGTSNFNVLNTVDSLGGLQELLLRQFLKTKCGKITSDFEAYILDSLKAGTQLDIEALILSKGAKIDNSSVGDFRTREISLEYSQFAAETGFGGESFESFLVNSFFNSSVGSVDSVPGITQAVEDCLRDLLTRDASQLINGPPVFYHDGGYVWPASEMLDGFWLESSINVWNAKFSSSFSNAQDDSDYNSGRPPEFLPWYKYPKGEGRNSGNLEPQGPAYSDYDSIRSSISLTASVSFSSLLNPNFKIF